MCNNLFKRSKIQIEKIYIENIQNKVINDTMTIISKTQVYISYLETLCTIKLSLYASLLSLK
jgi:hypothetical protein